MFNGRNLVAENRASMEEVDGLYYMVLVFSNNSEADLTFNDLSGSVFQVETLESMERRIFGRISAKDYSYQDLVNLGIQNLDASKWNEYKNEIDKLIFPAKEDIQGAINAINTGEDVPQGGSGGCQMAGTPLSYLWLLLPLALLRRGHR